MRKIPTIYIRDENDMRYVSRVPNPAASWVFDDPTAVATRKYDGTCVMLDVDGCWWARREVKPGKSAPPNFVPCESDSITGKTMGWEPIEQSGFAKHHQDALDRRLEAASIRGLGPPLDTPGTYELIGPKINGNPERETCHRLIEHARAETMYDVPTDFDGLRSEVQAWPYEGIVWHHPDGRMAKIKKRDFREPPR